MAIFVLLNDNDDATDYFTPCTCVRRNNRLRNHKIENNAMAHGMINEKLELVEHIPSMFYVL